MAEQHWAEVVFGPTLLTSDGDRGKEVGSAVLKGKKIVAVYFSASWCGPCQAFTPKLVEFFDACQKKDGDSFQVVFVSSDRDEEAFCEYYGHMPWLAVPFSRAETKQKLMGLHGVTGLPTLVVLEGSSGSVKSFSGRQDVQGASSPPAAVDQWLAAETATSPKELNLSPSTAMPMILYGGMAVYMFYKGSPSMAAGILGIMLLRVLLLGRR